MPVFLLEVLDSFLIHIILVKSLLKLVSQQLDFIDKLCFTPFIIAKSVCLFAYGLAHLPNFIPIVWVIANDINPEIKQVYLVLGLEDRDLPSSILQFNFRRLQLLDLSLSIDPIVLDRFCLTADRLELILHLPLLCRDIFQLQAQLAAQMLMLVDFFLFLL